MSKKANIFSKHLPNIKLATRFDAEGREIEVEVREDEEATRKQQEILDLLVASGYFRAYIKGLSTFNKIVGGMVWCMEACDHDVDVDLLFDENLSIGQQIALTEKIIAVLPRMACPYQLEPHQIQGLDVINIHPVIQWLCKTSAENRKLKAKKLMEFAVGQFHNNFQLPSDVKAKQMNLRMRENVRRVQGLFGPKRQYRRKFEPGRDEEERTRVLITLLEYGNQSSILEKNKALEKDITDRLVPETSIEEISIDVLFKSLSITTEEEIDKLDLSDVERDKLKAHFAHIKAELEVDSAELRLNAQLKELDSEIGAYEGKLKESECEHEAQLAAYDNLVKEVSEYGEQTEQIQREIDVLVERERDSDKSILDTVQSLIQKNEKMKQEEQRFKESCRKEMAELERTIEESEKSSPKDEMDEFQRELERQKEQLRVLRLKDAKQNRQMAMAQRQLDSIPDRTELSQYQKRFLELYNEVAAKHRETKQFFSLYNTLRETRTYMEKELNLLNAIHDSYNLALTSSHSKAEFLKQLESYVESISQLKMKQKQKSDTEKTKRDEMNAVLLRMVDEERHLAAAIKQLKQEFNSNDELNREYKALLAKRGKE